PASRCRPCPGTGGVAGRSSPAPGRSAPAGTAAARRTRRPGAPAARPARWPGSYRDWRNQTTFRRTRRTAHSFGGLQDEGDPRVGQAAQDDIAIAAHLHGLAGAQDVILAAAVLRDPQRAGLAQDT